MAVVAVMLSVILFAKQKGVVTFISNELSGISISNLTMFRAPEAGKITLKNQVMSV